MIVACSEISAPVLLRRCGASVFIESVVVAWSEISVPALLRRWGAPVLLDSVVTVCSEISAPLLLRSRWALSDSDKVVRREVIFTSLGGNALALEEPPPPVVSVDALLLSFFWPEDLSPAKAVNAVHIANAIAPNVRMLRFFNLIMPFLCRYIVRSRSLSVFKPRVKTKKVIPTQSLSPQTPAYGDRQSRFHFDDPLTCGLKR
ncbi:MAG: hypothetical protein ACJ8M1_14370 [Chthoniobacterales bacterium]